MTTMTQQPVEVTGGVDTHAAAVVDSAGRILGSALFPATGEQVNLLFAFRARRVWLCR